ncbi:hypothetical protein BDV96DRAFT_604131 [Lophiotrema nucula]|uniref:Uncharacterized protein n=1 Tax=Lophiotrema nucula TaxID=690887 RepID=A0A6A5YVE1_9PLEO|nr:hypothetical protein BDV96DRAFT_604131 [Lophiotrema nucula]
MAPTRFSVLALLAFSSSTSWAHPHEVRDDATRRPWPPHHSKSKPLPPVLPTPSNAISLTPPKYSVSWETQGPEPTDEPGLPPVIPLPSNQISLGPPSYSISWDGQGPEPTTSEDPGDVPTPTPTPEDPEDPTDPPSYPTPSNSNQISLYPPSASVSWDSGSLPTADPGLPPVIVPSPSNNIGLQPPKYSISWYRRQYEEDPEPTAVPEPEDPEPEPEDPAPGPIVLPPLPIFTPKNSIGIQPPHYSIIWGKRQDEEDPAPTEDPAPPLQTPPDQITVLPPQASVSWGKREEVEAATATNSIGLQFPTYSLWWPKPSPSKPPVISWGRRQEDEPEPTDFPTPADPEEPIPEDPEEPFPGDDVPLPPLPQPANSIGVQPPSATIIWGRDAEAAPQSIQPPTASIIWSKEKREEDKREAEAEADAQGNSWGLVWPTRLPYPPWYPPPPQETPTQSNGWISWGRNAAPEPTAAGISWSYPKPPKPTKPGKSTKKTTATSSSTQNGWISWGKRSEITAAPVPIDGQYPKPSACALTTTVTRPVPCPLIKCPVACTIVEVALDAEYAGELTPEPSEHATPNCPVTLIVPGKCPTCACGVTPLPPATPLPTKPHYTPLKPTPISKFTTSSVIPPPKSGLCPTLTIMSILVCVPPMCPQARETACDLSIPLPIWEVRKREAATIKTVKAVARVDISTCTGTPTVTSTAVVR